MNNNYYTNELIGLQKQLERLTVAYMHDEENKEHDPVVFGMILSAVQVVAAAADWMMDAEGYVEA